MDWQIRPLSQESSLSGDNFDIGERVVCVIYLDEEAELARLDVRESEFADLELPESILGRWVREVKRPGEEAREAQRAVFASVEVLFLSLYENEEGEGENDDDDDDVQGENLAHKDALKQVLALMLERKRILKPVQEPVGNEQVYRYVKTKQEYRVPMAEIAPEQLIVIHEKLDGLL